MESELNGKACKTDYRNYVFSILLLSHTIQILMDLPIETHCYFSYKY